MFGRHAQFNSFPAYTATDPTSYEKELQLKLAKLRDLVKQQHIRRQDMIVRQYVENLQLMILSGYLFLGKGN